MWIVVRPAIIVTLAVALFSSSATAQNAPLDSRALLVLSAHAQAVEVQGPAEPVAYFVVVESRAVDAAVRGARGAARA